ncbi:leucine-rich repeat-containing protein 72 [Carcharodon carcharias]|uniref:leucine-rich repeat-containing protein 72 n=1 Tax=Carcharodon carcharias TaxID=13397 RepID=UPI001B7EEB89|nr:leucine-rich repeat-containing protein 72 [Carcharodon carcharias]
MRQQMLDIQQGVLEDLTKIHEGMCATVSIVEKYSQSMSNALSPIAELSASSMERVQHLPNRRCRQQRRRGLTEVPDLSRYKLLTYLWVNHNKIKKLDFLRLNYHLKELHLNNNLLTDITDLFNNPLTQDQDYRLYVIYHLPSVQLLDRQMITQKERDNAFDYCSQDRFRIRQSLAFGQKKPHFTVEQIIPKRSHSGQKISFSQQKSQGPSEDAIDSRIRRRSVMQFSTLDWIKVPNAQQKRLGNKPLQSSQIITTHLR